eukprot:75816-Chlamydomonas_euryale.AAC.5
MSAAPCIAHEEAVKRERRTSAPAASTPEPASSRAGSGRERVRRQSRSPKQRYTAAHLPLPPLVPPRVPQQQPLRESDARGAHLLDLALLQLRLKRPHGVALLRDGGLRRLHRLLQRLCTHPGRRRAPATERDLGAPYGPLLREHRRASQERAREEVGSAAQQRGSRGKMLCRNSAASSSQ